MVDYEEDNRTFVVEAAINNKLGSKEEIDLYFELSLAMELLDDNFSVIDSGIGNGIYFGITTKFPHSLPEKIGIMFFNVDSIFNVDIKETSKFVYNSERHFEINIKI